jgi:hypothetical protein
MRYNLLKTLYLAAFETTNSGPYPIGTGVKYMDNYPSCIKEGFYKNEEYKLKYTF